jgi:tetratricopeptide (TPR) repeat protein
MQELKTSITFGVAIVLALGIVAPTGAQGNASGGRTRVTSAPSADVPFMMVPVLLSSDRKLAVKGQEEMQSYFRTYVGSKAIYVIPKAELDLRLKSSGYPTDTALSRVDAHTLAGQVRADEYLDVTVEKTANGYRFGGAIVLARNIWIREQIPPVPEAPQISQAARAFGDAIQKVRKQMPFVHSCNNLVLQEGKAAEAEAQARQGIAAYPDGVAARICLGYALAQQQKPPAEVIAVAEEVLKRDPMSRPAIALATEAALHKGDTAMFASYSSRLVAIDPTNPAVEGIVEALAQMGKSDVALDAVEKVLREDPENLNLLKWEFRLLINAKRLKEAMAKGEALVKIDTSYADTTFFVRMASIAVNDSQPQKAAEYLARGVQKFPTNIPLVMSYAQQLKELGQIPQAIGAYTSVLNLAPKTPDLRARIANYYNEIDQPDSALAWLRRANQSGVDDKTQIAGVAVQIANKYFTAAQQTKEIADYQKVLPYVMFADSVAASPTSHFIWGLSSFFIGNGAATKAGEQKSCALAKLAREQLDEAQIHIPKGGSVQPETAGQILQALPQLSGPVDQMIAAFCKAPVR